MEAITTDWFSAVEPFTLTRGAGVRLLAAAVARVIRQDIPGPFVECGVWRGGSAMVMAYELLRLGVRRHLFPGGLIIASINTHSSRLGYQPELERYEMHATIQPERWWISRLAELGWERQPEVEQALGHDWVRNDPYSFHAVFKARV